MCVGPYVHRKQNIRKKRWSDRENRFISTHRLDGYLLISEGLRGIGSERAPEAVRMHALRSLGIRLSKYPASGMRKCVSCGRWDARPNTEAGRAGFCQACWERRKAEAVREGRDEDSARREYQRVKRARNRRETGRH